MSSDCIQQGRDALVCASCSIKPNLVMHQGTLTACTSNTLTFVWSSRQASEAKEGNVICLAFSHKEDEKDKKSASLDESQTESNICLLAFLSHCLTHLQISSGFLQHAVGERYWIRGGWRGEGETSRYVQVNFFLLSTV